MWVLLLFRVNCESEKMGYTVGVAWGCGGSQLSGWITVEVCCCWMPSMGYCCVPASPPYWVLLCTWARIPTFAVWGYPQLKMSRGLCLGIVISQGCSSWPWNLPGWTYIAFYSSGRQSAAAFWKPTDQNCKASTKTGSGQNKGNLAEYFPGLLVCGGWGRTEKKGREEGGEDARFVLKLEGSFTAPGRFHEFLICGMSKGTSSPVKLILQMLCILLTAYGHSYLATRKAEIYNL